MPDLVKLDQLKVELQQFNAVLVAVSKTKPAAEIQVLYDHGHRDFGENYVGEMAEKYSQLPKDIRWHFIGHLQSNKVKAIAPFVTLIHGVDSERLMQEISKQAIRNNRTIDVLFQVHIASEETKFGFSPEECKLYFLQFIKNPLPGVEIRGLMGMASFTDDELTIRKEFKLLNKLFTELQTLSKSSAINQFDTLSMGMSSDYKIALEENSTMVRIGSVIFGGRSRNPDGV